MSAAAERRPRRLRRLQTKLALVFFAIIALAFAVVFFYVVPQLNSNLERQRLDDLVSNARSTAPPLERAMGSQIAEPELNELVRAVADRADARVTLFGVQRSSARAGGRAGRFSLYGISDSRVERRIEPPADVAREAARRGDGRAGVARSEGEERVVQAAVPLRYRGRADWVALYSRDLADVSDVVDLIRTEVLVSAFIALTVATIGGLLVARALARRVKRLERAARQVARGEFVEPLPVDSADELGELTRAFNEMQERLARVDRARREFIANASHELRTPVFSLGGFAELLQDEELDEETRAEFLRQMRAQIARLQKLAADLLDLSRLDAGSIDLSPAVVNVAEVARDVAREFTPELARRDTQLERRMPRRVEAFCNRERVAQIVRILLDNALRHAPAGARITLRAGRRGGLAQIAVADSGPQLTGRPLDASEGRLFERFQTGDVASGSGLGLAIAKELAERMDGTLELRPGTRETVFTLSLPIRPGHGGGAEVIAPAPAASAAGGRTAGPGGAPGRRPGTPSEPLAPAGGARPPRG